MTDNLSLSLSGRYVVLEPLTHSHIDGLKDDVPLSGWGPSKTVF
jgi:hypothetical protein